VHAFAHKFTTIRDFGAGSIPDEVIGFFFNSLNPPAALWPWGLAEMSTRNLSGDKGRPARKADNLSAIYEKTV
jgi:hypothetical protein